MPAARPLAGNSGGPGGYERMTTYERFRKEHPFLLLWEEFKLAFSEWLLSK